MFASRNNNPEIVKSLDWLNEISELRHDDLIFGGLINLNDIAGMMNKVKDCMEQYVDLYKSSIHIKQNNVEEIDYVVYGMLSEPDLLSELTTLIGRFRYAVEGNDKLTIDETSKKISSIGKYLPENRKIDLLLSSENIYLDWGSSFFVNGLFCKNSNIYLSSCILLLLLLS